jgi:hypothetical protein
MKQGSKGQQPLGGVWGVPHRRGLKEKSKTVLIREKVEGYKHSSLFSGAALSNKKYHSEPLPPLQEGDLNDAAWHEVVSTRLPANLEEQARQLNAWKRKREVRSVPDLLRALLVYATCQYSFKELGIWAVLKGIGSLCERGWRKRLDGSRAWIVWILSEVLGVHQTPVWLPEGGGRILLIDATRWKTAGGTGDDVRVHQSYELRAGRMEQVADRHQAESLRLFELRPGDLVVTDAGYPVVSRSARCCGARGRVGAFRSASTSCNGMCAATGASGGIARANSASGCNQGVDNQQ